MLGRIDRLADLGTTIITLSGGEPTLHPDLDAIIRRIRERGAIATLITNGLLLTPDRISELNRAGLDYLQISIDNVAARRDFEEEPAGARPEARMAGRARRVRSHDQFRVGRGHSESGGRAGGVGGGRGNSGSPARSAFCTIMPASLKPLAPEQQSVYERFRQLETGRCFRSRISISFQENIGARTSERLALPRRRPVPVHL